MASKSACTSPLEKLGVFLLEEGSEDEARGKSAEVGGHGDAPGLGHGVGKGENLFDDPQT